MSTDPFYSQINFQIRFEWGHGSVENLNADVIVIVDVLSFSTCVDIAVGNGAEVLPCVWKAEAAAEYAVKNKALLAGNRGISSYSLSPTSLLDIPADVRLVLPSPNGSTLSLLAQAKGAKVIAACLRNATAVAEWIGPDSTVLVVPAGERWPDGSLRPAYEDLVGAGAVISYLTGTRSPEAEQAVAAFENAKKKLLANLSQCSSGRELIERGFAADVALAAILNVSKCVPVLEQNAFRNCPS
jgi:2-phosphosulfolactate phosphatase